MKKIKNSCQGFTLLELLVVVVIIGILAAIALPQYRKAVEKSKASQFLSILQTMYQSAQLYQLTTGNWPTSLNDLDIDIPLDLQEGGEWKAEAGSYSGVTSVSLGRISGKYSGTGFIIYKDPLYAFFPKEKILCRENKQRSSYIFSGEPGSYCSKILNGRPVYVGEKNWINFWELP